MERRRGVPEGGMEIKKGINIQIMANVISQHSCFTLVCRRGGMGPAKGRMWALKPDFPGKESDSATYLLGDCGHTH